VGSRISIIVQGQIAHNRALLPPGQDLGTLPSDTNGIDTKMTLQLSGQRRAGFDYDGERSCSLIAEDTKCKEFRQRSLHHVPMPGDG
jgi:hypothetical protein